MEVGSMDKILLLKVRFVKYSVLLILSNLYNRVYLTNEWKGS